MTKKLKQLLISIAFLLLSSCGGGSSDSDSKSGQPQAIDSIGELTGSLFLAPGFDVLSRMINVSTIEVVITVTLDDGSGISRQVNAAPVGQTDQWLSDSFLVPPGVPFTVKIVWSAQDVNGNRVDYSQSSQSFEEGVSANQSIDLTSLVYSYTEFNDDGDEPNNFEELQADTPATDESGPITDSVVNGYRVSRSITYDDLGEIIKREVYTYDDEKNTINSELVIIREPPFDDRISTRTLRYDESGNLVRNEFFFRTESESDNELVSISTYEFDSANLITSSREEYFSEGRIYETLVTSYSYNNAGQITKSVKVDEFAAANLGVSYEPSTVDFTYDTSGNRQSATGVHNNYADLELNDYYNFNVQYTFNDSGQMVRKEWVRDDGEGLIYTYNYDENGNMIEVITNPDFEFTREVVIYEINSEPVYNHWLRLFKFSE